MLSNYVLEVNRYFNIATPITINLNESVEYSIQPFYTAYLQHNQYYSAYYRELDRLSCP